MWWRARRALAFYRRVWLARSPRDRRVHELKDNTIFQHGIAYPLGCARHLTPPLFKPSLLCSAKHDTAVHPTNTLELLRGSLVCQQPGSRQALGSKASVAPATRASAPPGARELSDRGLTPGLACALRARRQRLRGLGVEGLTHPPATVLGALRSGSRLDPLPPQSLRTHHTRRLSEARSQLWPRARPTALPTRHSTPRRTPTMVLIDAWDDFLGQAESLFQAEPTRVRPPIAIKPFAAARLAL